MKRLFLPLLALATLVLSGCGGSDSNGGNGDNQFAGTYDVVFSEPDGTAQQGTGVVTVDDDGNVSGTLQNNDLGAGTLSGDISDSGQFDGAATYGSDVFGLEGDVDLDASENFSGTLTQTVGNGNFETTITATRR